MTPLSKTCLEEGLGVKLEPTFNNLFVRRNPFNVKRY